VRRASETGTRVPNAKSARTEKPEEIRRAGQTYS
jgi:hypothetical protein